jgi:transposase
VDTAGLLLAVVITAASIQDRDGARPLLWNLHRACRRVRLVWADAAYTGKLAAWAAALRIDIEVVAKRDRHTFEVLPRRWVAERTFAWISKHRRTVRDYEYLTASHEAMILWAMIALMTHRLAETELSDAHSGAGRLPDLAHWVSQLIEVAGSSPLASGTRHPPTG